MNSIRVAAKRIRDNKNNRLLLILKFPYSFLFAGYQKNEKKQKKIKKTLPYSFEERLHKLSEVWMGWVNNYRLASIQAKLKQLDEWLRNRLRYCIWHDWKKLERKRKNLIRLGVSQGQAYACWRSRGALHQLSLAEPSTRCVL